MRVAQGVVLCIVKPFLCTKHAAGIGKHCLIICNWGCAYVNWIVTVAEDLDMFRVRAVACGGRADDRFG